jgi:hypothetical protein
MGTSASGIAAERLANKGMTYAADVGTHNLRKYVKVNSPASPSRD